MGVHGGNIQPPLPGVSLPRCEHVYVTQQTMDNPRLPGILLAVRKTAAPHRDGPWECYVVYASPGIAAHGGEPTVRQGWVEARLVERRP